MSKLPKLFHTQENHKSRCVDIHGPPNPLKELEMKQTHSSGKVQIKEKNRLKILTLQLYNIVLTLQAKKLNLKISTIQAALPRQCP